MNNVPDTWLDLAKPSKEQRRTLRRVGFSDWFVSRLATWEAADAAIAAGIELQGNLRGSGGWKPKDHPQVLGNLPVTQVGDTDLEGVSCG